MKGKRLPVFHLVTQWLAEVVGFILLPLIIYLVIFALLGPAKPRIIELPEWMLVSIIMFGETTRKSIEYYKNRITSNLESRDISVFGLKATREIAVGSIGVVVSSVLLVFGMIAEYGQGFTLPKYFGWAQIACFGWAVYRSIWNRVYIGLKTGEGQQLTLETPPSE